MNISSSYREQAINFFQFCFPDNEKLSKIGMIGQANLLFIAHLIGSMIEIGEGLYISCVDFTKTNINNFNDDEKRVSLNCLLKEPFEVFLSTINPDFSLTTELPTPFMRTLIEPSVEHFYNYMLDLFSSENFFSKHLIGRAAVVAISVGILFSMIIDLSDGVVCAGASLLSCGYFKELNSRALAQLTATHEIKSLLMLFGMFLHCTDPTV